MPSGSNSKDTKSKESKNPIDKRLKTPSPAAPIVTMSLEGKLIGKLGKSSNKKPAELLSEISKRDENIKLGASNPKASGKGLFGRGPQLSALSIPAASSSQAQSSPVSSGGKIKPRSPQTPVASSSRAQGSKTPSMKSPRSDSPSSSIASPSRPQSSNGSSIKSAKSGFYPNPAAGLSRGGGEKGLLLNPHKGPGITKQEPSPPSDDEMKARLKKEMTIRQGRAEAPTPTRTDATRLVPPKIEPKAKKSNKGKAVALERKGEASRVHQTVEDLEDAKDAEHIRKSLAQFNYDMDQERDEFYGHRQNKGKGKGY